MDREEAVRSVQIGSREELVRGKGAEKQCSRNGADERRVREEEKPPEGRGRKKGAEEGRKR